MAKYLKINGQVCLDTLPFMSRPFFFIALSYAASHFTAEFLSTANSFPQQIPFHSKFLSTANSSPQQSSFSQLLTFYCRFNQASILLFLSYVLHSFSARCALVNSWRNKSAERVLNVHSTKRKSENHYLYTCELI